MAHNCGCLSMKRNLYAVSNGAGANATLNWIIVEPIALYSLRGKMSTSLRDAKFTKQLPLEVIPRTVHTFSVKILAFVGPARWSSRKYGRVASWRRPLFAIIRQEIGEGQSLPLFLLSFLSCDKKYSILQDSINNGHIFLMKR